MEKFDEKGLDINEYKIKVIINNQEKHEVIYCKKGEVLFEALRKNNVFMDSPCSGKGVCGKCKVEIKKGIREATSIDIKHLTKEEVKNGFRLACNVIVEDAMEIVIEKKCEIMTVFTSGKDDCYDIEPMIRKVHCLMEKPCIENQKDDYTRLKEACGLNKLDIEIEELMKISEKLRKYDFNVTASIHNNKLINLEKDDTTGKLYGIAIDLGTTTIAVYLVNLMNGKEILVEADVNNQRNLGLDVISRINYTIENSEGLNTFKNIIIDQINNMISSICLKSDISADDIYDVAIVGNTTMTHLLLGLTCKNIALAPYIPVTTQSIEIEAKKLGIKTNGMISIVPGVSAYVGSDITAGILSCGMLNSEKYSLLLDLGTNGEMALGNSNEIITCSTAAGPAFEGANIKCGMAGVKGAICKVDLSKDKVYETIGDVKPLGICGSGVLDIVSQLLSHGIIDGTGRILDEDEIENEKLKNKIIEINDMMQFILVEKGVNKEAVTFTQKDVREIQLAKAAISAGIKILLAEKSLYFDDIDKVYIGGGFGNYMNIESAVAIGMIPKELKGKIESVGNCAGSGAKAYLLSKKFRNKAFEVTNKTQYIELSSRQDFQEYFIEAMMLE